MIKIRKLIAATALVIFLLSLTACGMIEKTPEAIAKSTVANVNGEKITRAELDSNPGMVMLIAQLKAYYGDNYETNEEAMSYLKTQKTSILQQMITEKLVIQRAKELKIGQDEAAIQKEVDEKFSGIKKGYETEEAFTTALQSSGLDETSFKVYLKDQIIIEKVITYLSKDVTIIDSAVKEEYDKNIYKYTVSPDTIHTAHILVATEDEAKKVKTRLDAGEDFAKIAKEVSTDTASKENGGDLGTVNYVDSGFDDTFMAAAIALKEGGVSAPVQTQFGYHIIKCIKKTEYPAKPFDAVKDEIKTTLLDDAKNNAVSAKLKEWTDAAKIKTYENNIM
ncbi:MAG: peptidylprolyl isomerase [Clostridiaceae bacterium]